MVIDLKVYVNYYIIFLLFILMVCLGGLNFKIFFVLVWYIMNMFVLFFGVYKLYFLKYYMIVMYVEIYKNN